MNTDVFNYLRIKALIHEPALELHSRDAPSVEAHHRLNRPDTKSNSTSNPSSLVTFIGKLLLKVTKIKKKKKLVSPLNKLEAISCYNYSSCSN